MRIKFTFRFWKYRDSKLATFISIAKGSIGGFFAWIGLFLLPLIIGCGIASQFGAAGIVAIVIGIIAVASYLCLFLIDEDNIGLKSEHRVETSQNSTPVNTSASEKNSIEKLRLNQITQAITFAAVYTQQLSIADEFLSTREEITKILNNDPLASLFR